ncbi:MAG: thioredoxin domain-containing protein [Gemmatimonadales bacterium]|nr:thioredoxin domain-containing protein [Gemmatimonadales bacterium]
MRMTTIAALLFALPAAAQAQPDPLAARSKGSPTAPITVYEMSDFQCPYCKRHFDQTFGTLEKEYVATGKVRWIFINLPLTSLHPNAVAAAELAMCAAKQNRFWPAHDMLFKHQQLWAPLKNPAPFFISLADSLRLNKAAITSCLDKAETRAEVKSDADGAVKAGAQSTPTFYIEGGLMSGAYGLEIWRPILDSIYKVKTKKP